MLHLMNVKNVDISGLLAKSDFISMLTLPKRYVIFKVCFPFVAITLAVEKTLILFLFFIEVNIECFLVQQVGRENTF